MSADRAALAKMQGTDGRAAIAGGIASHVITSDFWQCSCISHRYERGARLSTLQLADHAFCPSLSSNPHHTFFRPRQLQLPPFPPATLSLQHANRRDGIGGGAGGGDKGWPQTGHIPIGSTGRWLRPAPSLRPRGLGGLADLSGRTYHVRARVFLAIRGIPDLVNLFLLAAPRGPAEHSQSWDSASPVLLRGDWEFRLQHTRTSPRECSRGYRTDD